MNMKTHKSLSIISIFLTIFWLQAGTAVAQKITFDTKDYKSIGVYDAWEESPFRTGKLEGNCQVVDGNLALQRSRFGSNTFGARVDLNKTFKLTTHYKYIRARIWKPVEGRVMLIGLGKRPERTGQSAETEQFWSFSEKEVPARCWTEAVFAVKGNSGIDIHSLIVVPHCESPHNLVEDFACYIDWIEIEE